MQPIHEVDTLLRDLLSGGPVAHSIIEARAGEEGMSMPTVDRAARALG